MVSDIKRGIQSEEVREQGAEESTGPNRDDVTGGWRELRNNAVRSMRENVMSRAYSTNG
jgi:hypothetical protein